ncbi:hypothetical protein BDN67DRAFT_1015388 [Paxillus ammoniavirescens]|nr:hypothetical protein BDN67DRAFT_1015388 [Paxillus ammoniavirescens]
MKSQNSADTIKQSLIEVMGKVTQILYVQDGRHSVPVLRILDTKIMLSFFDRGGSVSPEMFLQILIGISFSPPPEISFDQMIIPHDDKIKQILVTWKEKIGEDKRKAGPGQPVFHMVMHDLESFFYVLLGFCVLYDEPYKRKPEPQIAACFDIFFNTGKPSLNKTINIQLQLSWSTQILPFISPYYKPLIPLLEMLCEKIVLPMSFSDDKVHSGNITHDKIIQGLLDILHSLGDSDWIAREHHTSKSIPSNKYVINNLVSIEELSDEDFSDSTSEPESLPYIERTSPIRELSGPGFSLSSSSY